MLPICSVTSKEPTPFWIGEEFPTVTVHHAFHDADLKFQSCPCVEQGCMICQRGGSSYRLRGWLAAYQPAGRQILLDLTAYCLRLLAGTHASGLPAGQVVEIWRTFSGNGSKMSALVRQPRTRPQTAYPVFDSRPHVLRMFPGVRTLDWADLLGWFADQGPKSKRGF